MTERSEAWSCPLADDCSSLCLEKLESNPSQGGKGLIDGGDMVLICLLL